MSKESDISWHILIHSRAHEMVSWCSSVTNDVSRTHAFQKRTVEACHLATLVSFRTQHAHWPPPWTIRCWSHWKQPAPLWHLGWGLLDVSETKSPFLSLADSLSIVENMQGYSLFWFFSGLCAILWLMEKRCPLFWVCLECLGHPMAAVF